MGYSLITGDERPICGRTAIYILNVHGAKNVRWVIQGASVCPILAHTASVIFYNASLGKAYTVNVFYTVDNNPFPLMASLTVTPLPGVPSIVSLDWQDGQLNSIGNRVVMPGETIYLAIRTVNIPVGDYVYITLWEKDMVGSDRNMNQLFPNYTIRAQIKGEGLGRALLTGEVLRLFAEKLNSIDWIDDSIHEYYVEVTYSNKLHETKKDILLKVKNDVKFNKNPNTPQPVVIKDDKTGQSKKTPVKLKLNIFFDGTNNNKWNVNTRKKPDEYVYVNGTMKKGSEVYNDNTNPKEDTSYNQDFSNVALMQIFDDAKIKDKEVSIYIEGIGTCIYGEDNTIGLGLGMDQDEVTLGSMNKAMMQKMQKVRDQLSTGIRGKVERGMSEVMVRVWGKEGERSKQTGIFDPEKVYIEEARINVIGFSRGSAAARHFVSKRKRIAAILNTSETNVIFVFTGLYDTVSAHGVKHSNDVKELDLAIGARSQKVVQLTAAHEHRYFFELTDIRSSIAAGVGYELQLPGVHSDIGGGYNEEEKEEVFTYDLELVNSLIEGGWHTKESRIDTPGRSISTPSGYPGWTPPMAKVYRTINHHYQFIPLSIMVYFAKKYGKMIFKDDLIVLKYNALSDDLSKVKDTLFNYAVANDGAHSIAAILPLDLLKTVRHKYLHLSSNKEGGHTGIKGWGNYKGGKPYRDIFHG